MIRFWQLPSGHASLLYRPQVDIHKCNSHILSSFSTIPRTLPFRVHHPSLYAHPFGRLLCSPFRPTRSFALRLVNQNRKRQSCITHHRLATAGFTALLRYFGLTFKRGQSAVMPSIHRLHLRPTRLQHREQRTIPQAPLSDRTRAPAIVVRLRCGSSSITARTLQARSTTAQTSCSHTMKERA